MDPQRRTLIVTGAVLLIILLIIFGTVFFLIRTILKPSKGTPTPTPSSRVGLFPTASPEATLPGEVSATSTPTPAPFNINSPATGSELYNGPTFQFQYPKNWSILTCSNSKNLELDPTGNVDQLNVACDVAQKPVTILVGMSSCSGGQVITLGNISVRKVVGPVLTNLGGSGTQYHWCTESNPALDITHRVGTGRAFSATDHATQVEQVISSLKFTQ
jgi:hypothetical protein